MCVQSFAGSHRQQVAGILYTPAILHIIFCIAILSSFFSYCTPPFHHNARGSRSFMSEASTPWRSMALCAQVEAVLVAARRYSRRDEPGRHYLRGLIISIQPLGHPPFGLANRTTLSSASRKGTLAHRPPLSRWRVSPFPDFFKNTRI